MDFNAYNMKRLADDECERKNQEKYKDIIDAIRNAAKEGKFCIDVTDDLYTECIKWLKKLEFGVYKKRDDNRWVSADENGYFNIEEYFLNFEIKHLYRIVW